MKEGLKDIGCVVLGVAINIIFTALPIAVAILIVLKILKLI